MAKYFSFSRSYFTIAFLRMGVTGTTRCLWFLPLMRIKSLCISSGLILQSSELRIPVSMNIVIMVLSLMSQQPLPPHSFSIDRTSLGLYANITGFSSLHHLKDFLVLKPPYPSSQQYWIKDLSVFRMPLMYVPLLPLSTIYLVNRRTSAKVRSSISGVSFWIKCKKRQRLDLYPLMVLGVYFLISISIKYSLIAASNFIISPPQYIIIEALMYVVVPALFELWGNQKRQKTQEIQWFFTLPSCATRSGRLRCPRTCRASSGDS